MPNELFHSHFAVLPTHFFFAFLLIIPCIKFNDFGPKHSRSFQSQFVHKTVREREKNRYRRKNERMKSLRPYIHGAFSIHMSNCGRMHFCYIKARHALNNEEKKIANFAAPPKKEVENRKT